jgi:hypothetical protein
MKKQAFMILVSTSSLTYGRAETTQAMNLANPVLSASSFGQGPHRRTERRSVR